MEDQNTSKLHIAFLPWLGFGHMLPFLELAKKIAQRGQKVSFISTPRNINRLPKVPEEIQVNFVCFPLPKVEGLPENAEATSDIPNSLIPQLRQAHDGLQEPIASFLKTHKPDWIIYDYTYYWLPSIASKLGVSTAYFGSTSASTIVRLISFSKFRKPVESSQASFDDEFFRYKATVNGCQVYLIRSCREFEGEEFNILQPHFQKPIVPFGLLPYNNDSKEIIQNVEALETNIVPWLNKQEKGSVVYVALGSESDPSQQDFHELALGLELSGLPFFWVLIKRKDSCLGNSNEDENRVMKYLPDGFEERTKEQGVVWKSWAPQRKILAHKSIGGFLTHCGWSSTIEGLQFGHPLIMLPFHIEQISCAKVFSDKKVGIEIPRNGTDKSFTKHQVAECVRLVMVDEKGKIFRDEAKKLGAIFGDHDLQDKYIDECIEHLKTEKNKADSEIKLSQDYDGN